MGKISPVAAKYIIRAKFEADGIVEKPDAIGAIFGQTEGLLGTGLELRELQKNGRIGRIEIAIKSAGGKSEGVVEIPSSLDKTETAIIAAAVETIDRIGPCSAKIKVENIEDVRISKRSYILSRAKELVDRLVKEMPGSEEMTQDVKESVMTSKIIELGPENLPAGPEFEKSEEVILVEGRADVLNLLRNGFANAIGVGGTKIAGSIPGLVKDKKVLVFLDGDRGGDIILKELVQVAHVDKVARAPSGKEVEELNIKEIHQCIRAAVPFGQAEKLATAQEPSTAEKPVSEAHMRGRPRIVRRVILDERHKGTFKKISEEIMGSRGAVLLNSDLEVMGKIPVSELENAINEVEDIESVIMDGEITKPIAAMGDRKGIKYVLGTETTARSRSARLITPDDLK